MFLKKMSCLVLAFSCVSIAPSGLPRPASSCNFDDAEMLDSKGETVSLQGLSTEAQPLPAHTAASAQPNTAQPTPANRAHSAKPALQPLTIPPHDGSQKTTPTTPNNSFADIQASAHSEPPLSTRSQQSLAVSAQTPGKTIPVYEIPPITPIATPRPNSPANITAPLAANALLASSFLLAPAAHSTAQSAPSLGKAFHTCPPASTIAQRVAANTATARLSTACPNTSSSTNAPQAAQRPMQLPLPQPAVAPAKQPGGDVTIAIAPESPTKVQKEDQPEYCCLPITCCGKTISCPKMNCVIL